MDDPNVDGFLGGTGKAIPLPAHYVEVFHDGKVASHGQVARVLLDVLCISPKCSTRFSYILLITVYPVTFVPIDNATYVMSGVFVFR